MNLNLAPQPDFSERPAKRSFSLADSSPFGFSNKRSRSSCSDASFSLASPTASFVGDYSVISPRMSRRQSSRSSSFIGPDEDSFDSLPSTVSMREREVSTEPSALPQPCNLSNPTLIPFFSISCDTGTTTLESRLRVASSGFSDTQDDSVAPELVDIALEATRQQQRDEVDVESTSATPALASMILGAR